jgi:hypothetical protein
VYKNVIDKGWRCGSSGWALTYHAQGPEFKLQHRKKNDFCCALALALCGFSMHKIISSVNRVNFCFFLYNLLVSYFFFLPNCDS